MKKITLTAEDLEIKTALNPIFIDKDSLAKFSKTSTSELSPSAWFSLVWRFLWRQLIILLFAFFITICIVALIVLGYSFYVKFADVSQTIAQARIILSGIVIFIATLFGCQILFLKWIFSVPMGDFHLWLVKKTN